MFARQKKNRSNTNMRSAFIVLRLYTATAYLYGFSKRAARGSWRADSAAVARHGWETPFSHRSTYGLARSSKGKKVTRFCCIAGELVQQQPGWERQIDAASESSGRHRRWCCATPLRVQSLPTSSNTVCSAAALSSRHSVAPLDIGGYTVQAASSPRLVAPIHSIDLRFCRRRRHRRRRRRSAFRLVAHCDFIPPYYVSLPLTEMISDKAFEHISR